MGGELKKCVQVYTAGEHFKSPEEMLTWCSPPNPCEPPKSLHGNPWSKSAWKPMVRSLHGDFLSCQTHMPFSSLQGKQGLGAGEMLLGLIALVAFIKESSTDMEAHSHL